MCTTIFLRKIKAQFIELNEIFVNLPLLMFKYFVQTKKRVNSISFYTTRWFDVVMAVFAYRCFI